MKYDLEGTSSSFTKLLNGNGISAGNSPVKISVGLLAHVVIRVESQGHVVNQTVALLGGLHQNINQQNHLKLHENLAQSRKQVETRKKINL